MELTEYQEYLRRIERAASVRELHRITAEARAAHPNDPRADAIDRACWARVEEFIAQGRRVDDWRARAAGA